MYNFVILAYDSTTEDGTMLIGATEIILQATSSAEAMLKARHILMAKNYHIKQVIKVNGPGDNSPQKNLS